MAKEDDLHYPPRTLLIVDDDSHMLQLSRAAARTLGYSPIVAGTLEQAIAVLENQTITTVLLGLNSRDASRLEPLRVIKSRWSHTFVIVVTSVPAIDCAIQSVRLGAFDYLAKPVSLEVLSSTLQSIADNMLSKTESNGEAPAAAHGNHRLPGRHPQIRELYRLSARMAHSNSPVLILGEPGTGKHSLAQHIHALRFLNDKLFTSLDCRLLPPQELEHALFGDFDGNGHSPGNSKGGKCALAAPGTVYLHEVGALPAPLQAKLLRAIDHRELPPDFRNLPLRSRLIAASSANLEEASEQGRFRRDLYFRLNVVTLQIPPLRHRLRDIPLLAEHILRRIGAENGKHYQLDEPALQLLTAHSWPGNLRELGDCLQRACSTSAGPILQVSDFTRILSGPVRLQPAADKARFIPALAEIEKQEILKAIAHSKGDKLRAAKLLGVGRTTLYRKLKDYGIEPAPRQRTGS